ncbi:hypothetical protein O6H91_18G006400 [Diphasiastrum complanatum]|nr:hypothetical protein O6H91_18G006400 [Diphasiastrum complanatum]
MFSIQRARFEENQAFHKPPKKDLRAWTSLIALHSKQGHHKEAIRLYFEMKETGIRPNGYVYVATLKACASAAALEQGRQIHSDIIANGFELNTFVCSTLINMYAKCNCLEEARHCFDNVCQRDLVSWNVMIGGYSRHGLGKQALELFETMQQEGIRPDTVTFVNILKACSSKAFIREGRLIHAKIVSHNLGSDVRIGNSLIDMYAKCGSIAEACQVFEKLQGRDVISWNSMIGAYTQHGQGQEALQLYAEMNRQGMKPNNITFRSVLKACASRGALDEGKKIHTQMINNGLHLDLLIGSSLVDMYVNCQSFDLALKVFYSLPVRDLVLWNTIITGYAQHGHGKHALELFRQMQKEGVNPDGITYVSILKACGSIAALELGRSVHDQLSEEELQADLILANALIDMYAKSGTLDEARKVFDKLQHRDVVSYNVLIVGYAQHGLGEQAVEVFENMKEEGISPNVVTFVSVLKVCGCIGCLNQGELIHAQIIEQGYEEDLHVSKSLIDMYFKCGSLDEACKVFTKLPVRNVLLWNTFTAGYVQHGLNLEALQIFHQMQWSGTRPDCGTFAVVLKACSNLQAIEKGKAIHAQIIDMGLESDVSIGNILIEMYGKCGRLNEAWEVFDRLPVNDMLSWNVLITGYVENGFYEQALKLFDILLSKGMAPNEIMCLSILRACGNMVNKKYGQSVHNLIIQSDYATDKFLGSALVDMYIKCDSLNEAHEVFESYSDRDVVLWNVMIAGYVHRGLGHRVFDLFKRMLQEGVRPTCITFLSILKACGNAAILNEGKFIHSEIVKNGFQLNLSVGNALIDMYCNCGSLDDAQHLFDSFPERDPISWNAMIAGYAQHGLAEQALQCFGKMLQEGVKPNEATFVSVLSACSHGSLLEDGFLFFHAISNHMSSVLSRQHYACMVDLLCRAGKLLEVEKFINMIPIQPEAVMWMSVLGACQSHRDVELGRRCFECIMKLDPRNTAAYVLMSNIYAASGRWEEKAELRTKMEIAGAMKTIPGCTWIGSNE